MIRVGGDYQAQIPEFKPGKRREERKEDDRDELKRKISRERERERGNQG